MQVFITGLTILSLFLEDIRIIFLSIESDPAVDIVNIVLIVVFSLEILLSLSVPGYMFSFFFFLDILSTISIIMDISMVTNLLYASSEGSSNMQLSLLIKNSKASRAAARTVRIMKIFRLARIVKLYKSAIKAKELRRIKSKEMRNEKLESMRLRKIKQAEKDLENNLSFKNIESQAGSKPQIVSG